MNTNNQQSGLYKKHLTDGLNFLTIIKNHFDNFRILADKNAKEPGSVNIDQIIQEFHSKVAGFFKSKSCTLLQSKEELIKATKVYA